MQYDKGYNANLSKYEGDSMGIEVINHFVLLASNLHNVDMTSFTYMGSEVKTLLGITKVLPTRTYRIANGTIQVQYIPGMSALLYTNDSGAVSMGFSGKEVHVDVVYEHIHMIDSGHMEILVTNKNILIHLIRKLYEYADSYC